MVLAELSNSSNTPTKDAPEVILVVPTSFKPIAPIVKSPPVLIVKFTTSLTVPDEISIPLIVSSVAAVMVPEVRTLPVAPAT